MISHVITSFASTTLLRVLSRVLEFFLRIYLIREVLTGQILARLMSLDLIITTALHLSKSCFKPSYQQIEGGNRQKNVAYGMNLMSVGVAVTFVCALFVVCWNLGTEQGLSLGGLNSGIFLYGFASVLEALKQKFCVGMVLDYQYRKIAIIELVSYLPKTFMLFVAARMGMFEEHGIVVFGFGQVMFYGMCFLLTFCFSKNKNLLLQKIMKNDNEYEYFDKKSKKVLRELSFISLLKLVLQQFEKIVLVFNSTVQNSSVYSIVSNLGSIIVRFLFAPLEQIAYNYYARGSEDESKKTLISLVKILVVFGSICIGFGCRYGENVLYILYGEKWLNNESILAFQFYTVLLSVLGLNGAMQSFVMARADVTKTVPKFKYYTLLSTSIYIASSFLFLHYGLGASGLFLGNSVGMIVRIIISWNIEIKKHLSLAQFVIKIMPSKSFLFMLVLCLYGSILVKDHGSLSPLLDLGVGILLLGICLLPVLFSYKNQIEQFLRTKTKKGEKTD